MQWWDEPVHIAISNSVCIAVNSTERAAQILLYDWPIEDTPKQQFARGALLRALERPDDPGTMLSARITFTAAAEEAGILMAAPPDTPRRKHR